MAVDYDKYLLRRLTDNDAIRSAQKYKKQEVSYAGILYSLSLFYNIDIDFKIQELLIIINEKYLNKELYFDLHFIFRQNKVYKDLFMEELKR